MNEQIETLAPPVDVDQLDTAKPLVEIFQPYATTLEKWAEKVKTLAVTDIGQKTEMAQARLARLEIKDARVAMERTRLGLVEKLKERTRTIDAFARGYRVKMEALEEELRSSEEFGLRHAAKLKEDLKVERETVLAQFADGPILGDLSDLTPAAFEKMVEDAKFLRQARLEAAKKAEEERAAKAAAEREERQRMMAENTRLRAEAVEKKRLADLERKRIEEERAEELRIAKVEADRIQAQRVEEQRLAREEGERLAQIIRVREEALVKAAAERREIDNRLAAQAKALAKEKAQLEKARRDAELAPDKAKLTAFAASIRLLTVPTLSRTDLLLRAKLEEWASWVEEQIENL